MVMHGSGGMASLAHVRLHPETGAEQIMGMPATKMPARRWTEEEFKAARDAAPPGERWELVDGEVLVTPSPHWRHQGIVVSLLEQLLPYCRSSGVGRVFTSPLDVKLAPGLVLQPDALVVPHSELRDEQYFVSRLALAVEILSPSSARFDRVIKRPHYQRNRVPEYWVIDAESRTVERWQPDDERPAILSEALVWHPEGVSAELVVDIPSLFADPRQP